MAKVKAPVTKLTAMHHIGYGAGDAGGVLMLMMISYLEYFSRNILGISSYVYAAILLVWNVWDAINDPMVGTFMDIRFAKAKVLLEQGLTLNEIADQTGFCDANYFSKLYKRYMQALDKDFSKFI